MVYLISGYKKTGITRKILAFWFDSLFQKKRTNWMVKYLEKNKKLGTATQQINEEGVQMHKLNQVIYRIQYMMAQVNHLIHNNETHTVRYCKI